MTVAEAISQVKTGLRLVNADTRFSNKYIWSVISTNMRTFIQREGDKLGLMQLGYLFQTKKCVDVWEAPAIDECCGVKSKCKVWRTVDKMPYMYQDSAGPIIKSVYAIDGSSDFAQIKPEEYMRKLENPHTRKYDKSNYYYYNNGYLYFPNSPTRMVMVKGYFEDEVINGCEGDKDVCKPKLHQTIYLPQKLEAIVFDKVVQQLAQAPIRLQDDSDINKNTLRK